MFLKNYLIRYYNIGKLERRQMRKSKSIKIFFLIMIISSMYLAILVNASTTVVFSPTDDTMIKKEHIYQQSGYGIYMTVRNGYATVEDNNYEIDSLIMFDLFSIPSTAIIHSASIHLYYYDWSETNPAGRNLTLYLLTSSWTEEYANWYAKPSYTIIPSSSAIVPNSTEQWMTWDVTSDVQYLVNERAYYGWRIADETNWNQPDIPMTYFRTKENENYIPYLEITYTTEEVNTEPISGFSITPSNPTTQDSIEFRDTSYDPDGMIVEWLWTFGDGTSSTNKNPLHTYKQSGEYTVTLQVTDSDGLTNVSTELLSIAPQSTPGFEFLILTSAIAMVLLLKVKWKKNS
jgi:hypothetical protein